MKKSITLLGVLSLVAVLFACAPSDTQVTPSSDSSTTTTAATEAVKATGSTGSSSIETEPSALRQDGCFTNERLAVTESGGAYYLNFFDGNQPLPGSSSSCELGYIQFRSIREFYDAARGTDTSYDNQIKAIFPRTENGILTVNTGKLFRPTLPTGLVGSPQITWCGSEYQYIYSFGGKSVCVSCDSLDARRARNITSVYDWDDLMYDTDFDRYPGDNQNGKYAKEALLHENGTFDGVPCETVVTAGKTSTNRYTRLTVQDGDRNVTIILAYLTACDESWRQENNLTVSDTVPCNVLIRWTTDTDKYVVWLNHLDSAPTLEWLLSFNVTPYNPNEMTE